MKLTRSLQIILILSVLATLGSLYIWRYGDPLLNLHSWDWFNPLNALLPCDLCRYMRVFQYPLIIVAWVGLFTKERSTLRISLILSSLWLIVALYKMSLEYWWIIDSWLCTSPISCSDPSIMYWWRLSLPLMGVGVFIICIFACILALFHPLSLPCTQKV
jgi:disulfide bond formation protein DsbB